jgi:hypothetical protein
VHRHVEKELAELKAAGVFRPARHFPETTSFVKSFEVVLPRRPILAIGGGNQPWQKLAGGGCAEACGRRPGPHRLFGGYCRG